MPSRVTRCPKNLDLAQEQLAFGGLQRNSPFREAFEQPFHTGNVFVQCASGMDQAVVDEAEYAFRLQSATHHLCHELGKKGRSVL
jgi:hypothetical protein